jgi:hypothetical protein
MPQSLFALQDARVTPYIAQFGGISYQIGSISGIRASEGKRLSWLAVFMFFWGVGLFVIAIATSGPEDHATANLPEALDAAGIVFFSFLIQLLFPRRVYNLILRTHGADVEVLASRQRKSILDVKQAVETALAAHAQRTNPTNRTASQILVVIPGRRSEAEASPESSKPPPLVTGFRALGPSSLAPE